jgi:rSAM/selenodomain-associated transferase 2
MMPHTPLQTQSTLSLISVIIPALDEATNLSRLIPRLAAMPEIAEIIICDGGSDDQTVLVAQQLGARVVMAPRNRGAQMNAGAAVAGGKVLWFLHADCWPHQNSARAIARAVQHPKILGGNFRLKFASPQIEARLFERIARLQRRFGVYYGDSGLWLRRETFEELGCFPSWPLFEDYALIQQLEMHAKRTRSRTKYFFLPLIASSRRFEKHPWRTLWLWLRLQVLFSLGVSPEKLSRMYRR